MLILQKADLFDDMVGFVIFCLFVFNAVLEDGGNRLSFSLLFSRRK